MTPAARRSSGSSGSSGPPPPAPSGGDLADLRGIIDAVQAGLRAAGLDVDIRGNTATCCDADGPAVKVVCVAPDLQDSVAQLGRSARDQVVMVRVDETTSRALDAWVQTGAVRSRSEAAALFIREGLGVRADELARLEGALADVDRARDELRRQARKILGEDAPGSGS